MFFQIYQKMETISYNIERLLQGKQEARVSTSGSNATIKKNVVPYKSRKYNSNSNPKPMTIKKISEGVKIWVDKCLQVDHIVPFIYNDQTIIQGDGTRIIPGTDDKSIRMAINTLKRSMDDFNDNGTMKTIMKGYNLFNNGDTPFRRLEEHLKKLEKSLSK
jgi:hypothetical protein